MWGDRSALRFKTLPLFRSAVEPRLQVCLRELPVIMHELHTRRLLTEDHMSVLQGQLSNIHEDVETITAHMHAIRLQEVLS